MDSRHYINWTGLLDLIQSDMSINFLAMAISPWHALSIDATLLFLLGRGIKLKGIICCCSHYETGWAIDESYFLSNCAQVFSMKYDDDEKKVKSGILQSYYHHALEYRYILLDWINLQRRPLFYFVCPNEPYLPDLMRLRSINKQLKCVKCDEGVATYMTTLKPKHNPIHSLRDIWRFRHFIRENIFGRDVRAYLHSDISTYLFNHKKERLVVNEQIVPYYKEVFERQSARQLNIHLSDYIIICTTAWQREEIVDEEDLRVLLMVCKVLKKKGYRLLLKTHPRDNFFISFAEKMSADVFNYPKMSMELLCQNTHPKAVISFSSTTLITPKIFWDIPCYCLTDMLDRKKIGGRYLEEIDSFKSVFGNMVEYIPNMNVLDSTF